MGFAKNAIPRNERRSFVDYPDNQSLEMTAARLFLVIQTA
jgi:hypothetical protein